MTIWNFQSFLGRLDPGLSAEDEARWKSDCFRAVLYGALAATASMVLLAQGPVAGTQSSLSPSQANMPPRVAQAQRFLAQRGWSAGARRGARFGSRSLNAAKPQVSTPSTAIWQPLGPNAVLTTSYGLVTGRVSSLALDPADPTGNRLYVGTTGGGVWVAQNAASSNPTDIVFNPLTDTVAAFTLAQEVSISIGAVTVQPGGTGVVLAGTGDPNDALDSYYGAGILRSTNSGESWSLISATADRNWNFMGEGFAGFAWSTTNPQLVVAAVSQALEGVLVNAPQPQASYEGLYYSTNAGATWNLAVISDGPGQDVQGPTDARSGTDGNAATAVVWNPVRQLFIAAVRFHGYYQSSDGITWTRMAIQPGARLSTMCPTDAGAIGSTACPIFRGALAVNPLSGDTFAWTVDLDNRDVGIFQDLCGISAGQCTNQSITFAKQWDTTALETAYQGAGTIANGDYNLVLAAVPSEQDTLLLAGANDLWQCSLAMGCTWRNTTNANGCMSAGVAGYQHALAWNPSNSEEILLGNDSGLWRSMDAIAETGSPCSSADASHFQNLNGSLGSLAEVESMAQASDTPYAVLAGLGANGSTGVKATSATTAAWPLVLGGEGGPVAIDQTQSANWYVNNGAGVSIHKCSQTDACTPADFGASPVVDMDVPGGDGMAMTAPATFLVDAIQPSQLLIGTCRVWRVPADGSAWTTANAISPILDDGASTGPCSGDALIRSIAVQTLPSGGEVIYVGMFGWGDGGDPLAGHVWSATLNASGNLSQAWRDLTSNPVTNDVAGMNAYNMDVSSIFIDPHDPTGNTVYVTIAGIRTTAAAIQTVYQSIDGGAHWLALTANLPWAPANSIVVDPQDTNTVYVATDMGVYSTRQVASCSGARPTCWSAFGSGLPESPIMQLIAAPAASSAHLLSAATYGRGIWQVPLWTASENLTTATAAPSSLSFASQAYETTSTAQPVTVTNTGSSALMPTSVATSGDFGETDNCVNAILAVGASCTVQVTFTPTQTGSRTGQLTISANIAGGQLTVALSGTGGAGGALTLNPATVGFGSVEVGTTSAPLPVSAQNTGAAAISFASAITGPFAIASNLCGTSVAANSSCQLTVTFSPTQAGSASGALTFTDSQGTQSAGLSGTGAAPPTDTLSATSLAFPSTVDGQLSLAQTVTVTNSGDLPLTSIAASASGDFQTSNNCGTQLNGKSTCTVSVVFAPTQVGAETGTLTVSDILRTQTASLSGTGLQPPIISVNPTSMNFAPQQTLQASAPQTLTVSNSGGAPMANVGFQITGPATASFSTGTTTCGAILENGGSCTVPVTFTPAFSGGNTATLVVSSSTLGVTPVSVPLNGGGTAATGLTVNPTQLVFPATIVNQPSVALTVTISDPGSTDASALAFNISPSFSLAQKNCGTTLTAGSNCTVGVVFTPSATGAASGALTVSSPALAIPAMVALVGTGGTQSGLQIAPASLSFPTTGVGQQSSPITATITNTGTIGTLNGLALAFAGSFQLTDNTCPSTLAPQATCTVGVVFAPTAAGSQTGTLTATSSAPAATVSAALSGAGYDFAVTVSGPSSQTVASGQTASYTLVLSPMDGLAGTFTFQCGGLPANAACTFNPTTENVGAGVTGNVGVQIATAQSGTSAGVVEKPLWPALPLACGLLMLPLAVARNRRRVCKRGLRWSWKRDSKAIFLAVLLAIAAGALCGCAGAGFSRSSIDGGGSGSGSTSTGTYSIPVTVTSSGVQHSFTLTLVVD